MGHQVVLTLLVTISVFVGIHCADPVYVDPNDALRAAALVQPTVLANPDYVTQNVYGFADFTTTIGNTVMIFSPHSIAPPTTEEPKTTEAPPPSTTTIETKPIKMEQPVEDVIEIRPTKPVIKVTAEKPLIISSVVQIMAESPKVQSTTPKLKVEIVGVVAPEIVEQTDDEDDNDDDDDENDKLSVEPDDEDGEFLLQDGNNIGEPEYDFLSRQPTEFVEETFRVVNLKPSTVKTKAKKTDTHPTGLVTKSGGTVVKDGVTTVHETSVIGTFISGKYAQVLQSTSHIFHHPHPKPKISPSSTLRILKTAAPSLPKQIKAPEDTLAVESIYGQSPSPNLVRSSRRPANPSGTFKNRFRNRNKDDTEEAPEEIVTPSYGNGKKLSSSRRTSLGKPKNTRTSVEVPAATTTTYESRRNKASRQNAFKPSTVHVQHAVVATESFINNRKSYKPKVTPQNGDNNYQLQSIHPIKLNRTLGRWKYKTTPKPRVTIRKHGNEVSPSKDAVEQISSDGTTNDIVQSRVDLDVDLDGSGSVNGDVLNDEETGAADNVISERKLPIETIKVEISTPADFSDTYYEIATIKSPYTFQVGSNKNTRYITVTSTFKKTIEPETSTSVLTEPLTENILATTSHIDKEHNLLDSSIATLPPITLADDQATPPLETLTETFSTTQIMLKTHILPVIRGTNTTSYTLIQTYHVTRLVTATKTLPPMELYQFVPSRTLNEFNSKLDEAGSELHLELEFGDENEHDEEDQPRVALPPDLDLSNIGVDFDISEVDKTKIPRKQQRPAVKSKVTVDKDTNPLANLTPDQLALLRLLNPAQIPSFITTSKPIVHLETVYESHVIPIINGDSTYLSTISRPVATVSKTEYEIGTSTLLNYHQPTQQLQLQHQQPLQLIPQQQQQHHQQQQQQQQFQLQSTPVVEHRTVTQTDSKILKLTFGAKTAYTTLYNTRVIPTMVTSFVTQSIAVQQSAPYPGYFPGPYPPYPYVG